MRDGIVSGTDASGPITLLTDYGLRDAYVGIVKGVIAGIAPDVSVIDISHDVEPQNIRRGGLLWRASIPYFPEGSTHVAVIDPGVGSRRKILALRARGQTFLAPDNGLVAYALDRNEIDSVHRVSRRSLFLEPLSQTFHGRDIFAPVAARIAKGLAIERVGPEIDLASIEWPEIPRVRRRRRGDCVTSTGEVIDIDRFGNCLTNLEPQPGRFKSLEVAGKEIRKLSPSYASVPEGRALVIVGSTGRIEVSIARGSASSRLGIAVGDVVRVSYGNGSA